MSADKHEVSPEHAQRMWDWLQTRGGIAIWQSVNLANPIGSWSSPALTPEGEPTPPPTWECARIPARIITDPAEIVVLSPKEVERFRVFVHMGKQGMSLKLTDHSTAKLRRRVAHWNSVRAEQDAWHIYDYSTQECIILVNAHEPRPLVDWIAEFGVPTPAP